MADLHFRVSDFPLTEAHGELVHLLEMKETGAFAKTITDLSAIKSSDPMPDFGQGQVVVMAIALNGSAWVSRASDVTPNADGAWFLPHNVPMAFVMPSGARLYGTNA